MESSVLSPPAHSGAELRDPNEIVREIERYRQESAARQHERVLQQMRHAADGPLGGVLKAFVFAGALSGTAHRTSMEAERMRVTEPVEKESHAAEKKIRHRLEQLFGVEQMAQMIPMRSEDSDAAVRERDRQHELTGERLAVNGFDDLGFRNETLQQLLVHGYPRHMTSRNAVGVLRYTTEHIPMPSRYNIPGNIAGQCTISPGRNASEIVITVDSLSDGHGPDEMVGVESTIAHELTHSVDWLNAAVMDPETRMEFLYRVTTRVRSGNRLQFPYVEAIRNDDPQQQLRDQATEYIAELGRAMLTLPSSDQGPFDAAMARVLSETYHTTPLAALEDVHLMQSLVAAADPEFDWRKAHDERSRWMNRMEQERNVNMQTWMIEAVVDPTLRQALLSAFRLRLDEMPAEYQARQKPGSDRPAVFSGTTTGEAAEPSLLNRIREFTDAEMARIRATLPPTAVPAFEALVRLAAFVEQGRHYQWHQIGSDEGFMWTLTGLSESVHETNDAFASLSPEDRQAFLDAAQRYIRVTLGGQIRLPRALADETTELAAGPSYHDYDESAL